MSVVDDQLSAISGPDRHALEHIRKLVHKLAPEAEEVLTYGMPGFKYRGKYLCSFAAFKDHLSFFPGAMPVDLRTNELRNFKTSKGTIQFSADHPIPDDIIEMLLKNRVAAIESGVRY